MIYYLALVGSVVCAVFIVGLMLAFVSWIASVADRILQREYREFSPHEVQAAVKSQSPSQREIDRVVEGVLRR